MIVGRIRRWLLGAACAALAFAPALAAAPAAGPADNAGVGHNLSRAAQSAAPIALPSLAPLVSHVLPAVVNISVELTQQAAVQDEGQGGGNEGVPETPFGPPFDQFLRRFFENQIPVPQPHVMALGSGFIIDPQGDIVTNNHVVANADKVTVIFQDGSQHPAKVVGRDQKTDLALLKIKSDGNLPYVDWGNSNQAKVGDWVVAVGDPFGLGGTVTAGIVSAIGRNISDEGPYDDFLQIDAPINRGNSGGPTFDLSGQVIGINTAIYSPSGGSVGIGFAIPSNTAKYVVTQLKEHGRVTWGWLGVAIQNITPSIAKSLGLDPDHPAGALVASVVPGSPAAKAGVKSGDVITKAGDHTITDVHDLPRVVAETPQGSKLDLTVYRDGESKTIVATIGEMPKKVAVAGGQSGETASALGLTLQPVTPELRDKLGIGKDASGVVVAAIAENSPARALGIAPGDVIVSIDQQPATTPTQAAALLQKAASRGNILLLLNRHGADEFVGLSIENGGAPGGRS
jgi:serine protease Do